ncbi:transmembrane protein 26-like isoform X2 [Montipora foliosa]
MFLYLMTIIPCDWIAKTEIVNCVASSEGGNTACLRSINESDMLYQFLKDMQINNDERLLYTMEQALVLILVIGRWLLPKGDITRDELSQLLLSYIGTAADIMDFTAIITEDIRRRNPEMLQNKHFVNAIFLLWSVSLFQFSLTIYAMERTEQRLENGKAQPMKQLNKLRREKDLRRRRNQVAPSEALYTNKKNLCKELEDVQVSYIQTKSGLDIKPGMVTGARMKKDEAVIQKMSRGGRFSLHRITKLLSNSTIKMQHHSELIRLFIPLFMQDGPFLIIRLIVIAYYGVYHDTLYFLTVKNALVVMIQVYRIFVLCYKPPEKDIDDFSPENDAAHRLNNVETAIKSVQNTRLSIRVVSSFQQKAKWSRGNSERKKRLTQAENGEQVRKVDLPSER